MVHLSLHRWAGSKQRIIDALLSHMRPDPQRHNHAIVPFWGSGVDGRAFAQAGLLVRGGDTCAPLVIAHNDTLCRHAGLLSELAAMRSLDDTATPTPPIGKRASKANPDARDSFYLRMRKDKTSFSVAARFLYLVGVSFNGLYRTNSKGEFNVPYGRPFQYDPDVILAVADQMRTVNLLTRPWQATLDAAQPGDLVYCDPPYLSNFVGYHGDGFSDGETCSLFAECKRLSSRGCDVWMSNAGTDRIRELAAIYGSATLISVDARRSIAANGGKRGVAKELLIKF
jgi:DNA adenine methylase